MKSNGQRDRRVVTANLPEAIVANMDVTATRLDRSKSWIVKQAVTEWLARNGELPAT